MMNKNAQASKLFYCSQDSLARSLQLLYYDIFLLLASVDAVRSNFSAICPTERNVYSPSHLGEVTKVHSIPDGGSVE